MLQRCLLFWSTNEREPTEDEVLTAGAVVIKELEGYILYFRVSLYYYHYYTVSRTSQVQYITLINTVNNYSIESLVGRDLSNTVLCNAVYGQISAASHLSLHLPQCFAGLGQTPHDP